MCYQCGRCKVPLCYRVGTIFGQECWQCPTCKKLYYPAPSLYADDGTAAIRVTPKPKELERIDL